MRSHSPRLLNGIFAAAILIIAIPAFGQQPAAPSGIGVVTALQGQATVARQALPAASALHFRDDVFFRDQIATRERSTVRLLLGGKGVVTVREQSQVTLDETVAPDGGRRSILSVLAGKIVATIAHSLMRPGDEVEVRTPDAVAAIRGTVLIAEYIPPKQSAEAAKPVLLASSAPGPFLAQTGGSTGGQSNFFVLNGNVVITPLGQPPLTLGPLQGVSLISTSGGVQPGAIQNITPAQVIQALQGLDAGRPLTGEVGGVGAAQTLIASLLAQALVGSTGGEVVLPPPPPVQPPPPPPPSVNSTENVLPSGPLLSLTDSGILVSGAPVAEFGSGPTNSILPPSDNPSISFIDTTTSPIIATGNSISHSGTMISLTNSAASVLDDTSTSPVPTFTPVMRITGTSLTNTGGPLFSITGNNPTANSTPTGIPLLETLGSVLSVEGGGSATLDGILTMGGDTLAKDATVLVFPALVAGGSLLSSNGGTVTGTGPALDAVNSSIEFGGPIFSILNGSRINWTGGPLVKLNGSHLVAGGGFGNSNGAGNVVNISGVPGSTAVMLDATDSTIEFGSNSTPNVSPDTDFNAFSAPPGVPLFLLTNSTYIDNDPDQEFIPRSDGTSTFDGLLVVASNSDVSIAGRVFSVHNGEHLTTTTTDPLIRLDRTPIHPPLDGVNGNFLEVCCGNSVSPTPSVLNVNGPILSAVNSNLRMNGALLMVGNGGTLNSRSSTALFQFDGGAHNFGSVLDINTGNLNLDPGLLASTERIVALINGATLNTNNASGAMSLVQSSVTSNGPVIGLNNSTLNVNTGPLLSLSGGSSMTVNGDFATLKNLAKVNVVNGPLIAADGAGTKLFVTGNLVNFVGTGNQVVFSNTIPNDLTKTSSDGVTARGNVVFGGPVINNLAGNTFSGLNSSTGPTAISATNGAKVCVKTGGC